MGAKAMAANRHNAAGQSADEHDSAFVNATVRHMVTITPGGTDIANGPCDALNFSDATTAVIIAAEDDDDESQTVSLSGGMWHPMAARQVVSVSGGVTVVAGWYRRPGSFPL